MGILAIIGNTFKLLMLILGKWAERDAEKKKLKGEAANEVKAGLKDRDPNRINAGFDKLRRVR